MIGLRRARSGSTPDSPEAVAAAIASARTTGAVPPPGYEPIRVMAQGRRCVTWDAWDVARDCRCVVKVLRADRLEASDPAERERLVRATLDEGHILLELGHPHLVRAYDVVAEPVPAIVMATLGGSALDALIDEGPLGAEDVALLGLQLCSALGWLHHHDWLHLDLKPANVVVESGRATLIDLGLAARPGPGEPGSGTRGYLAPEQATGADLTPATDVWGLGITLLEALSGELPYGDEATWGSRRRRPLLDRRMPTSPRPVPDGLPPTMADVLRACVALDPAARPDLPAVRAVLRETVSDR